MDDVHLLSSPFTFPSMEEHAACCALIRLGLKVPKTWLVPCTQPVEHAKYASTAARDNRPFDLDEVAEQVGYPLFRKPYDGFDVFTRSLSIGAEAMVMRFRPEKPTHDRYAVDTTS